MHVTFVCMSSDFWPGRLLAFALQAVAAALRAIALSAGANVAQQSTLNLASAINLRLTNTTSIAAALESADTSEDFLSSSPADQASSNRQVCLAYNASVASSLSSSGSGGGSGTSSSGGSGSINVGKRLLHDESRSAVESLQIRKLLQTTTSASSVNAVSLAALPCPALPCPALPCPALPCPALPCPAYLATNSEPHCTQH